MTKRKHTPPADDRAQAGADAAHAPGKKRLGPPADRATVHRDARVSRGHDQPWVPTSGLVGRSRRSARRG